MSRCVRHGTEDKGVSPPGGMHPSGHPRLVGVVAVVILCAGSPLTSALQPFDYVSTELDDPLQPVWDRLDDLPRLVSDTVQSGLRSQFSLFAMQNNRKLDTKLQQAVNNSLIAATSALNTSLVQAFQESIGQEISEMVRKIEGHIDNKVGGLETSLKAYIDEKLSNAAAPGAGGGGGNTGLQSGASLSETLQANTATLENINTHVLKINEKIGGGSESEDSCVTLVDKVSELMAASADGGGGVCSGLDRQTVTALTQLTQASTFLPRDCSDKHWQQPEDPSGVYQTFPTMDPKAPVNTYCDMGQPGAKETGGWTVILRRRNSTWGLVNFNRTWDEYRDGFGNPGESEWWFGLAPLHALTYRQPYEVDLLLHDIERGTFRANYNSFRVEDEAHNFTLNLNGFAGNLSHDALIAKHHGSSFSTWDRDNDVWHSGSCAQVNGGGWWFNACHYTTLTAPFPTSNNRSARTIRWLENDDWLVLDDVTMKIRPINYDQRFNAHHLG